MSETAIEPQPDQKPALKSRPSLVDRQKLRLAYIRGEGSLLGLCREHAISYSTAREWSEAENWPELLQKAEAKRLANIQADVEAPKPPNNPPTVAPLASGDLQPKIEVLEKQITRADELISTADSPKAFVDLTKAKGELLRHYYHLCGIPGPGSRKPKEGKRTTPADVAPVE